MEKFDPQKFYEPLFDDQPIFGAIERVNQEIVDLINANQFQFSVKNVKEKKLPEFIKKFEATDFFLLCFQIKPDTKGKGKAAKQVIDMRVGPDYLQKIDAMCLVLGDKTVHRFESNKQVVQFVQQLNEHGFEFKNEHVVGICYDAKHGHKILRSCFEFGEDQLQKIIWHDPKVAHWLLDPDVDEPNNLLHIADDYLQEQLNDVDAFLNDANKLIQNSDQGAMYTILFRTILLYPVMVRLRALLSERGMLDAYRNVEMPALLLFGDMELTGFTIDRLKIHASKTHWDGLIRRLTLKLQERNGGDVNPRSPQQMQELLRKAGLYEKYVEAYPLPEGMSIESLKTGREVLEKVRALVTFRQQPMPFSRNCHLVNRSAESVIG